MNNDYRRCGGSNKRLSVAVEKAPDFKRFHATVMFGGVNPVGELEFSLMEDTITPPEQFEMQSVGENVYVEAPLPKPLKGKRILHATVVMPIHVLPGVIRWLQSKYEEGLKMHSTLGGGDQRKAAADNV